MTGIFPLPLDIQMNVMCSKRRRNEPRRVELFLYIDHWAGVTPLLGVKSQLALNQNNINQHDHVLCSNVWSCFSFRTVADNLNWPRVNWVLLLQSALVGKAQEI